MSYAHRRAPRADLPSPAATITNAILARLEAGTRPWVKPWTGGATPRPLRACGTPYRGVNVFWLWLAMDLHGYTSPYWMTYQQAQKLGGQVRKGEKSTISIYYKSYRAEVADEISGDPRDETRRVLRSYAVFNAQQIDGLPERFQASASDDRPRQPESDKRAAIDAFFTSLSGDVRHGGGRAYYSPSSDHIQMPEPQVFISYEHYGATLAHEYAHWSGSEKRLARAFGKKFGDHAYAVEELTAELTSAILGSELELPVSHLDDHASYIASWIRVLKADSKAILTIASKAEEAASYLLALAGRTPEPQPEEVETGANDDAPAHAAALVA